MKSKYSVRDFKNSTPEWKRKKETFIGKILYRPLSYVISCILANMGVKPNSVSFFSVLVSVLGCAFFLFESFLFHILGAIVFIVWAILDCVDGDMARTIGRQPFGDFADAISCYILQGFMCTAMGVAAYFDGGILMKEGNIWIIVIGCLASSANCLMRLIYQKYISSEKELVELGIIQKSKDVWKDKEQVSNFKVKFKETMGVGGILPFLILIAVFLNALDIMIFYCFIVYGGAFFYTSIGYVRKTMVVGKKYDEDGLHQLDNIQ